MKIFLYGTSYVFISLVPNILFNFHCTMFIY